MIGSEYGSYADEPWYIALSAAAARAHRIIVVSRHRSALCWMLGLLPHARRIVRVHLQGFQWQAGDLVVGVLPMHHAAAACRAEAEVYGLVISLPIDARGHELDDNELRDARPRLSRFVVEEGPTLTGAVSAGSRRHRR